jgi:DNA-binding protein HU-beta
MNKSELVEAIAKRTGGSKAMTDSMVDAFVDSVTGCLRKGETVTLVGFGTFSQGKRAARTGRNPQTGAAFGAWAAIKIPAARTAKFTAGARLKAAVNGKK